MNNLKSIGLAPRLAVGVLAVMAGTMALAQEAQQMPQVTVQAEREVTITRGDRVGTSSRHMGQLVSATQTVDLSDLHLGSAAGAHEAHQRIDGAARAVCSELTAYYPNGATDVPGYEQPLSVYQFLIR